MQVTVTNISTSPVFISDMEITLAVGAAAAFTRSPAQVLSMPTLMALIGAGTVALTLAADSGESAVLTAVVQAFPTFTRNMQAFPAYTTATRPAASGFPAGGVIFDSTLKKPLWSTGSAWVDATGSNA